MNAQALTCTAVAGVVLVNHTCNAVTGQPRSSIIVGSRKIGLRQSGCFLIIYNVITPKFGSLLEYKKRDRVQPNYYYIFTESGHHVGRHRIEDASLNPKKVFALPEGVRPRGPWRVESTGEGFYRLLAFGAPTAAKDDLLFAFLHHEEEDYNWRIVPRGNGLYSVENRSGANWVAEGTDKPIAVVPFMPPQHHLFRFVHAPQ